MEQLRERAVSPEGETSEAELRQHLSEIEERLEELYTQIDALLESDTAEASEQQEALNLEAWELERKKTELEANLPIDEVSIAVVALKAHMQEQGNAPHDTYDTLTSRVEEIQQEQQRFDNARHRFNAALSTITETSRGEEELKVPEVKTKLDTEAENYFTGQAIGEAAIQKAVDELGIQPGMEMTSELNRKLQALADKYVNLSETNVDGSKIRLHPDMVDSSGSEEAKTIRQGATDAVDRMREQLRPSRTNSPR